MAMSKRWRAALAGGGALLAASIGGLIVSDLLDGPTVERDEQTQEFTESGNADVMTMKVGDCFDEVSGEEIMQVPVVPCDQAHDNEIYYSFLLSGDELPSVEEIDEQAELECIPHFDEFVGMGYQDSALGISTIHPTQGSWDELDDREVLCVIFDLAGPVEGSLAGAQY